MELIIGPAGAIRAVYDEDLDFATLGPVTIRRSSHVEPGGDGLWYADLGPVRGPVLGPFSLRSEALAAEVAWLQRHWLLPPA